MKRNAHAGSVRTGAGLGVIVLVLGCGTLLPTHPTEAAPGGLTGNERSRRPARPSQRPAGTTLATAPLAAPTPESPFALGINEAVSVPAQLARTMSWEDQARELAADAGVTAATGARLVRGHTGNYPPISMVDLKGKGVAGFRAGDEWIKVVEAAGLEPVMMVSPWPGNETGRVTASYVPTDMVAYAAYVTSVVERYDGDGVDDMPGLLRGVRYWEVDNEPDLKNSLVAKGSREEYDPALFCTPPEYAQVFLASAKAIKAAAPAARVLNGGLYRPHSVQGSEYFRQVTAVPGVVEAIDILSVHTYHDDLDGERLAIGIRNERTFAPTKPVWVTETSLGTNDEIDEADQARMVVTFVARTALEGADKLFWHTLADPPPNDVTRHMPTFGHSLYARDEAGTPTLKPVGAVFQQLAAFLALHDLNGCVADGRGAVRLKDGSVLLYEGARAVTGTGGDLRTGKALSAGDTANAPAWLAAAG